MTAICIIKKVKGIVYIKYIFIPLQLSTINFLIINQINSIVMSEKRSYAEIISQVRMLIEAMRVNVSSLPQPLNDVFINELESLVEDAERVNVKQEKLKADLKTETAKIDSIRKEIDIRYSDAKKRIKLDFPKERWLEFGFSDKR